MDNLLHRNRLDTTIGNRDWQSQLLKEQFGQLRPSAVTLEFDKGNDLLSHIEVRLSKSLYQVIRILKELKPF